MDLTKYARQMWQEKKIEMAVAAERKKEEKKAYEEAYHTARIAAVKKQAHKDAFKPKQSLGVSFINASISELGMMQGKRGKKGKYRQPDWRNAVGW